jgi:hypothetical protein
MNRFGSVIVIRSRKRQMCTQRGFPWERLSHQQPGGWEIGGAFQFHGKNHLSLWAICPSKHSWRRTNLWGDWRCRNSARSFALNPKAKTAKVRFTRANAHGALQVGHQRLYVHFCHKSEMHSSPWSDCVDCPFVL